jgi:hypothetical protein
MCLVLPVSCMQGDGNLVLKDVNGVPYGSTGTSNIGVAPYQLIIQATGGSCLSHMPYVSVTSCMLPHHDGLAPEQRFTQEMSPCRGTLHLVGWASRLHLKPVHHLNMHITLVACT